VGDRPTLTAQPTILQTMVLPGGDIMVEIPVSAQTRYVLAGASDGSANIGQTSATTTGSETIPITIPIDSTAGTFPNAWVTIILCVDQSTCLGSNRTSVTYLQDDPTDSQYFISVADNGASLPAESKFSCYDILKFVIN